MIISISGSPGSGKSTVAEKLSKELGFPRHYAGGIRRAEAKKRGLTLAEFNTWSENNPEGDAVVDGFWEKLAKQKPEPNIVAEGRTVFYFIPNSIKIYLYVTLEEGARRIWHGLKGKESNRNEGSNLNSIQDVLASVKQREESDQKRYLQYYGIDYTNSKNFDLYIDVTNMNQKEEYQAVYNFIKKHLDSQHKS